ncbi:MAG: DUF3198 domain-containing protein [Euryarchaeota archaeon]|nr:DUF3198 domain-containing protein [Euryarchaeota archaeon]
MGFLAKFLKNNMLVISALVFVVGLAVTLWSWWGSAISKDYFAEYLAQIDATGKWNLWVQIISPLVLLTGAWYLGDQIITRRKFGEMIATQKKSEFVTAKKELTDIARRLPDRYKAKIEAKEAELTSKR